MLQPRPFFANIASDVAFDIARRWQGTLALFQGRSSVLRAGRHTRIARTGEYWHSSSRGGASASALARTTALTLLLLVSGLVSGPGTPLVGVALSQAPRGRASGSPPPLLLATSLSLTSSSHQTQASLLSLRSPRFHFQRGYSVQYGWLCFGWPSGAYHCTARWRVSDGRYVSLNPGWVPSQGSTAPKSHAGATIVRYNVAVRNTYPYGQCTWGAQHLRPDENLSGLGNAKDWLWNAQRRGLPTGYMPRVGATVVFQPGVDGASWLGHVAHVVALGSGGRFEIEAMNDAAGWGRYAFRWVQMRAGVSFIY